MVKKEVDNWYKIELINYAWFMEEQQANLVSLTLEADNKRILDTRQMKT